MKSQRETPADRLLQRYRRGCNPCEMTQEEHQVRTELIHNACKTFLFVDSERLTDVQMRLIFERIKGGPL